MFDFGRRGSSGVQFEDLEDREAKNAGKLASTTLLYYDSSDQLGTCSTKVHVG